MAALGRLQNVESVVEKTVFRDGVGLRIRPGGSACPAIRLPSPASRHQRARPLQALAVHHDAARQNADGTVQHAHMGIGHEMGDTLLLQQAGGEGHGDGVVGAKQFFHPRTVARAVGSDKRLT